jgi:succinyl-diaminopimelate desuccinylase
MNRAIFDFIDGAATVAVELESELTKRPAVSPDSGGEGEFDKCEFLEYWLPKHGIERLERFDAPDARAKNGVRPNLVATIAGRDDTSRLWIMSHLDVVPPGERSLWDSDPWTVIQKEDAPLGARLIGRGVEDNQQGLVSSVIAALALIAQGVVPPHTVKLLFTADEEMGSAYGILYLLEHEAELFHANDMVLIPDSGDAQGASIEIAEKNLLWITFTIKGVQAHGSRPDQGTNARLIGAHLTLALHVELSKRFAARDPLFEPPYSTFEPTKSYANVPNINTIPGEDAFCMDMRILPRYPLQTILDEIDRVKAVVERQFGVPIRYTIAQRSESKATAADATIVTLLSSAVKTVYHVKTRPIGIGGGTVAAPLRNRGIDAAVWARIEEVAHQPNEYALISNLLGDAKVMALLMTGTE